ncbi:hypothetical protein [Methanobrevibacter sp.]|uniref:hypothetical protein n=1 Tax=Methanobrevibacter sp. TaxID=66852 RepID=UPI002E76A5D7|nr:hypothetical protein [Methanobrevibacter sp.]MEE1337285.1 hypothetical protein [Methanobrevibacter sp.]
MEIHTMSGFVCDVNEKRAKDWRFARALADWDSGDESRAVKGVTAAIPLLLGKDGEEKLMEHIADEDGIVDSETMISEFKEIIVLMGAEVKKSQPSPE